MRETERLYEPPYEVPDLAGICSQLAKLPPLWHPADGPAVRLEQEELDLGVLDEGMECGGLIGAFLGGTASCLRRGN